MKHHFIAPPNAERSLTALISNRPALTEQELANNTLSQHASAELTCFSELAAGSSSLHLVAQRVSALPFRCSMVHYCCDCFEHHAGAISTLGQMLKLELIMLSFWLSIVQVGDS